MLARLRIDRRGERLAVVVVHDEHAAVVHDRRRRGAEVQIHRLRIESRRPERLAVERVGEQPDVAEVHVEPLAVGGRRLGREGVLAMAPAERRALVRFALPLQRAGAPRRRRRPCSGSRRSRLVSSMSRDDDALDDFVVGQALLRQLRGVVVAEDAGRRRLERAGADRGRDEHLVVPGDRRRPAAALHVDAPRDVVGRRPRRRQLAVVEDAGARRAAELRPGHQKARANHQGHRKRRKHRAT